jgi:hypothetical protein
MYRLSFGDPFWGLIYWRRRFFGWPKQLLDPFQTLTRTRTEETKVTDFDEAFRQHMLQKAVNEVLCTQRTAAFLTRVTRPV